MKNFKKIASAIAALSLAACVAVPMSATVFTASAATIKFSGETGETAHKYDVYQIFKGDATESNMNDGTGVEKKVTLTNVQWSDNTSGGNLLTALKDDDTFKKEEANLFATCESAQDVADVLSKTDFTSDMAKKFAELAVANFKAIKENQTGGETGFEIAEDGYYVLADAKESTTDGTKTLYLLGVVDKDSDTDITVTVKAEAPEFTKEIGDINDSTETAGTINWGDSADHDKYAKDKVPFKLKATLPDDLGEYDKYQLIFHDDLQQEVFTAPTQASEFTVKIYDSTGETVKKTLTGSDFTMETGCDVTHGGTHGDGCDFQIKISDLKSFADYTFAKGDYVEVTYTAAFTDDTIVGKQGNWNTGLLEYSNNPYNDGDGDTGTDTHSKTPEKSVVAFTYKTVINKVDEAKNPLEGAEFTLKKQLQDNSWVDVATNVAGTAGTAGKNNVFTFDGLDDGHYKLEETKVPATYNKMADVEFDVKAEHDVTPDIKSLTVDATSGSIELTPNLEEGSLTGNVENKKGATLPSTGGIGTTLFYLGGGALVAVAGVMLITKKRMTKE